MNAITEERLEVILRQRYGLEPNHKQYKVRDGYVDEGDMVWWRGINGPEHLVVNESQIQNIQEYPDVYQIARPIVRVEYLD